MTKHYCKIASREGKLQVKSDAIDGSVGYLMYVIR